jgi:hypothetical protein
MMPPVGKKRKTRCDAGKRRLPKGARPVIITESVLSEQSGLQSTSLSECIGVEDKIDERQHVHEHSSGLGQEYDEQFFPTTCTGCGVIPVDCYMTKIGLLCNDCMHYPTICMNCKSEISTYYTTSLGILCHNCVTSYKLG